MSELSRPMFYLSMIILCCHHQLTIAAFDPTATQNPFMAARAPVLGFRLRRQPMLTSLSRHWMPSRGRLQTFSE